MICLSLGRGTRPLELGLGEQVQETKTPASPSGPNLERGAGHLRLCSPLGRSQSLHRPADSIAPLACGLNHSGPSLAGAPE